MQKVINVFYSGEGACATSIDDVNELLKEGWRVVLMQSFSENVSITGHASEHANGAYGMTFVLERYATPRSYF